ncbi:uncharacterized protein N7458_000258 [Penicillium daleae]|uniref:CHAT domain-containing protein n=1 Tax=Penicillium daleae TaxID=63821 RepID=A0AAD6CHF2_9EURO|nr:uncharacterized protein N7458_000258 [Penicillium daleae]KAJ5464572.1 hypothetical protein N7458_000258 [Penicillium daleae]
MRCRRQNWLACRYFHCHAVIARNVEVSDPLTSEEHVKSRWYLERFIQQNPYEELESREALRLLSVYAASILEQLQLRSLVETRVNLDTNTEEGWELAIEVVDSEANSHTIHQLFWELLEDPQLFNADFQTVTVVRSLKGTENPRQPIREVAFKQQESTINILLVVARDTNRNAALYHDISPFLATDILLNIKRDLERNHRRVHMNIEIVRPGTLKAFEDHLAASERQHGPGYFHVVHFDLHGKIGARSGALEKKKYAFLYFSHPSEGRTKPERVQKIAAILQRYQVPFVVLNACESARAGMGDDANIAKVFCKGDIRNVVAMSFKISSSAASMFLREFYTSLLVTGCSFSASARRARTLLRCSPERSARFGLQKPLMDWFVPVVYGSVAVSVLQTDRPVEPRSSPPLIGRDFDVLRFERSLIQERLLYLYGPRGSGKSSFVQYVSSLWQETSRVEAILYLDMAAEKMESLTDLIRILIRKLSENLIRTGSKSVVSAHILDVWLTDKAGLVGGFLDILRKVPTFIIFDNLNVSHSDTLKGAMSKSLKAIFNKLAKTLFDFVHTCPRDQPTYLVLVGCRSFSWAQEKLGYSVSNGVFELPGLEMADAIEMIQGMRGKSDVAGKEMISQDMDGLELIINLFQGLPGALKLLEGVHVPLHILYDNLRSLPRRHGAIDIQSGPHLREISDLLDDVPDYCQPLTSLLGSFWHEGGSATVIVTLFPFFHLRAHGSSLPLDDESISTLLRIFESLQDLGYMDQDDDTLGRAGPSSIHPMLSIYSRLPHTYGRGHSLPGLTEGAKTEPFGNISDLALGPEWLELFVTSVVGTVQVRWHARVDRGGPSDHLYELGMANFPNMLNCLDICINEKSDLPLVSWPLKTFIRIAGIVSDAASVVEFRLFAQTFEILLDAFYDSLGSLEVPIEYQFFASSAHMFLVSAYARQGMSSPEVTMRLVDRGLEVFKATESKYGLPSSRGMLFGSGWLYFMDTFLNLELGALQKARSSWQQALELMALAADDEANETGTSKSDIEAINVDGFLDGLLRAVNDMGTTQSSMDELSTLEIAKVMYEKMNAIKAYMEDLMSGMEQNAEPGHSNNLIMGPDREMLQVLNELSTRIDCFYERQGLSRQTPRFIQNMLDTNAEDRFGEMNMLSRLERMETSADIGDWSDVGEQHLFFITAG